EDADARHGLKGVARRGLKPTHCSREFDAANAARAPNCVEGRLPRRPGEARRETPPQVVPGDLGRVVRGHLGPAQRHRGVSHGDRGEIGNRVRGSARDNERGERGVPEEEGAPVHGAPGSFDTPYPATRVSTTSPSVPHNVGCPADKYCTAACASATPTPWSHFNASFSNGVIRPPLVDRWCELSSKVSASERYQRAPLREIDLGKRGHHNTRQEDRDDPLVVGAHGVVPRASCFNSSSCPCFNNKRSRS